MLSSTSPILLCRAALLTLSASDNQPLPNFDLSELPFDEPRFVLSHTNIRLLLMTFGVQPPDLVTYISLRGNRLHGTSRRIDACHQLIFQLSQRGNRSPFPLLSLSTCRTTRTSNTSLSSLLNSARLTTSGHTKRSSLQEVVVARLAKNF